MKTRFSQLHAWLYDRTSGRLLGSMGGQPVALLRTIGRRSGRARTTPIQYLRRDDGSYVVVAANGGAPQPPAWWANLRAQPSAVFQIGGTRTPVVARETGGAERERLWAELIAANPAVAAAAAKTDRTLPVVVLAPQRAA